MNSIKRLYYLNMKKKNKNKVIIRRICLSFIALIMFYPLAAFGRFKYEEATTDVNNSDQKDRLTIIYRENCSRCKRTLPQFILKHGLSPKRINVINADKLNQLQLRSLGGRIMPVFRLNDTSYNIVDKQKIEGIYDQAK